MASVAASMRATFETGVISAADFADSLAVFAAPKRIGLRSYTRLSGALIKSSSITSSDVSKHFRLVLKNRLGGLTFAEAPLSAISRFNWSPESTKARQAVQSAS